MEYTKKESASCPRDGQEAVHTLRYKKATCTRVPDTLLHFICSKDTLCKECREDYL